MAVQAALHLFLRSHSQETSGLGSVAGRVGALTRGCGVQSVCGARRAGGPVGRGGRARAARRCRPRPPRRAPSPPPRARARAALDADRESLERAVEALRAAQTDLLPPAEAAAITKGPVEARPCLILRRCEVARARARCKAAWYARPDATLRREVGWAAVVLAHAGGLVELPENGRRNGATAQAREWRVCQRRRHGVHTPRRRMPSIAQERCETLVRSLELRSRLVGRRRTSCRTSSR